jgi:hypothetical protein
LRVAKRDRSGIAILIDRLRSDFNGDFLGDDRHDPWTALSIDGFGLLDQFPSRTDMRTGVNDRGIGTPYFHVKDPLC